MPYSRTGSSATFIALGFLSWNERTKGKQSTSDFFRLMYVLNNAITFFSCSRVLLPDITILSRTAHGVHYYILGNGFEVELFPTDATVRESYGL
jgi:hypothetical protein